jgi:hypothetical protein
MSSTNTDEAGSSRYRSFEPAVRGTGVRRRCSTTTDEGRPTSLVRLAEAVPAWSAGSRREADELAS